MNFAHQGYQAKIIQIDGEGKSCACARRWTAILYTVPTRKGHYDRVNDAVYNLLQKEDVFTREVILEQAREYRVCPFEMSLDTATWADDIIGDYNYVFDPNVYLKRFLRKERAGTTFFWWMRRTILWSGAGKCTARRSIRKISWRSKAAETLSGKSMTDVRNV